MACTCHRGEWAVEDAVVMCMAAWCPMWGWGVGLVAWAGRGVVSSPMEVIGVVCIKAVGDSEVEDSGTYEMVVVGNGCPNHGRGFVTIWG
jgi:hypothetical protein